MILKFRAWDNANNEMIKVRTIDFDTQQINNYVEYIGARPAKNFIEIELMQSTGLFDRNGVEIFEADILYIFQTGTISHNFEAHDENRKVVFFEGSWCIENYENTGKNFGNFIIENHYPIGLYHTKDEIEVIGNIYENKDLLEVENE